MSVFTFTSKYANKRIGNISLRLLHSAFACILVDYKHNTRDREVAAIARRFVNVISVWELRFQKYIAFRHRDKKYM
jgi:hypothetical protein